MEEEKLMTLMRIKNSKMMPWGSVCGSSEVHCMALTQQLWAAEVGHAAVGPRKGGLAFQCWG